MQNQVPQLPSQATDAGQSGVAAVPYAPTTPTPQPEHTTAPTPQPASSIRSFLSEKPVSESTYQATTSSTKYASMRKASPPDIASRTPLSNSVNHSGALDKSTSKSLIYIAIAFLIFFFAYTASKFYTDERSYQDTVAQSLRRDVTRQATAVSTAIGQYAGGLTTIMNTSTTPQETVNRIMQNPQIAGAVIISADNQVIYGTPNAVETLSQTNVSNFPQSGILITSLIAEDGSVNPLIVTRFQNGFLITALTPGTLLGSGMEIYSLTATSGRVIDGIPAIARTGPISFYGITEARYNLITQPGNMEGILSHKIGDDKVWLTYHAVPNSSLILMASFERGLSPAWTGNLIFFAILFIATCALVIIFCRNFIDQLKRMHHSARLHEIAQQRYRAIIDGSHGGMWEIDTTANSAFVSRSLAKLVGLPDNDQTLTLSQFVGLFQEDDREKLFSVIRRAHMVGDFHIDVKVARLPISLSCRGHASVRGTDNARVVIGMAVDVTEQRGAQIRLQAAEDRLNDALRSMSDSFAIWDPMNRLVTWNSQFEDFFGFQKNQLQSGLENATIEYHSQQHIDEVVRHGDNSTYDILLKDGRWIRYHETLTTGGSRVCTGTDITEIRTREQQLEVNQQALEKTIAVLRESQTRIFELAESYEQEKIRAEEANQSKSDFLANMSHELRTPLNAINGFSDIMKKELFGPLGDPRYKEYVNDILFSGQHLLSLINDILDMSKIEAGKMSLNTEVMQMTDMVQQVIRIVRGRAEDNRLKLIYEPEDLPEIEADTRYVKQVLLNLLTNAIKFTPEGGKVSVDTTYNSAGLIIKITDSGIGIAKEDINRLAKPFEQIESEHSRQHEGTGLGLALSKAMVELHGGNFLIESEVNQGTTVTFTLPNTPIKKDEPDDDNEISSEISRLAQNIADVLEKGGNDQASATPQLTPATPTQAITAPTHAIPAPPQQSLPNPQIAPQPSTQTHPTPTPAPAPAPAPAPDTMPQVQAQIQPHPMPPPQDVITTEPRPAPEPIAVPAPPPAA